MNTYPPWFSFTNFILCLFQNEKARKEALEAEIAALTKEKSKVEASLAKKSEQLEIAKKSIREGKRMFYIAHVNGNLICKLIRLTFFALLCPR